MWFNRNKGTAKNRKSRRFGLVLFGTGTLDSGQAVTWEGDLAVGVVLMVTAADGSTLPLPAGSYMLTTDTGEQFTIEVDDTGAVVSMEPVATGEAAPAAARRQRMVRQARYSSVFGTATTADGVTLQWDGDLAPGVAINEVADDGTTTPADGEYVATLEDGTQVRIVATNGTVETVEPVAAGGAVTARQIQAMIRRIEKLEALNANLAARFNALQATVTKFAGAKNGGGDDLVELMGKIRRT